MSMIRKRRRRSHQKFCSVVSEPQSTGEHVQRTVDNHTTSDLIGKIWGSYLRDEHRYDAWGALGKILVVRETLAREGFPVADLTQCGAELQRLVNLVFPRTFVMERDLPLTPGTTSRIREYYQDTQNSLVQQGMDVPVVDRSALDETAAKFSCRPADVQKHLLSPPPAISRDTF